MHEGNGASTATNNDGYYHYYLPLFKIAFSPDFKAAANTFLTVNAGVNGA